MRLTDRQSVSFTHKTLLLKVIYPNAWGCEDLGVRSNFVMSDTLLCGPLDEVSLILCREVVLSFSTDYIHFWCVLPARTYNRGSGLLKANLTLLHLVFRRACHGRLPPYLLDSEHPYFCFVGLTTLHDMAARSTMLNTSLEPFFHPSANPNASSTRCFKRNGVIPATRASGSIADGSGRYLSFVGQISASGCGRGWKLSCSLKQITST